MTEIDSSPAPESAQQSDQVEAVASSSAAAEAAEPVVTIACTVAELVVLLGAAVEHLDARFNSSAELGERLQAAVRYLTGEVGEPASGTPIHVLVAEIAEARAAADLAAARARREIHDTLAYAANLEVQTRDQIHRLSRQHAEEMALATAVRDRFRERYTSLVRALGEAMADSSEPAVIVTAPAPTQRRHDRYQPSGILSGSW